jgi:hypothetical protein
MLRRKGRKIAIISLTVFTTFTDGGSYLSNKTLHK